MRYVASYRHETSGNCRKSNKMANGLGDFNRFLMLSETFPSIRVVFVENSVLQNGVL